MEMSVELNEDANLPLLEPLDNLLVRGSLLYNLDSPGEYGSDLLSADSFGGYTLYFVFSFLAICLLVSKVVRRPCSVLLTLIPMHPSTLSNTLIMYQIDRCTPFIPSNSIQ